MKKSIHLLVTFSMIIFFQSVHAESKIVSETEFKMITEKADKELNNEQNPIEKRFKLAMYVARQAFEFRYYEKANWYYTKAIEMKVDENKTEAYINKISIAINSKDPAKIKTHYLAAKNYLADNKEFNSKEIEYFLTAIEKSMSNSKSDLKVSGILGMYSSEENYINLIKNKKYAEAFSLVNPSALEDSDNSFRISSYDALNVYMNRKNVKILYCDKEYKQYPNAYAYSTLICGLLNDYLKNGVFEKNRLKRAEGFFAKQGKDKSYLLTLVKEIK